MAEAAVEATAFFLYRTTYVWLVPVLAYGSEAALTWNTPVMLIIIINVNMKAKVFLNFIVFSSQRYKQVYSLIFT